MHDPIDDSRFSRNRDRHAVERAAFEPELGVPPGGRNDDRRDDRADMDVDGELKTGTTTVGLAAADGVVLATDMRASAGNLVASKDARKILEIHPQAALTIAGAVSAAQSLVRSLRAEVNLYETRRDEEMSMQALSTLISNFLRSGAFFIVQPVLGGVDSDGSHVYSIDPLGSLSEEPYTASGSGTPFAYGVLESEFEEEMSTEDARTVAARAVNAATERDTASGNGLLLSEITDDGVAVDEFEAVTDAL
jgi:proteasome beta subunit